MILKEIENIKLEMIETLKELVRIPAISPDSGGEGEVKKAEFVQKLVEKWGFDEIKRYDCNSRPNIIAKIKGIANKTLWVVTHLDIVPPGDLCLWKTAPFKPVVKNGNVYGRGSEDNGQELVASMYACKALLKTGKKPNYNIGLALVSDEETGSEYGIKHLLKKNLFLKDDLIIVPDGGNERGDLIEVAEKGIMWLKIKTEGKQCHASMPERGINAFRVANVLASRIDEKLHLKFNAKDKLFSPEISTFEPTKKESNVPNINTIPGSDIFYIDCRILPLYKIDNVLEEINAVARNVEKETNAKIHMEIVNREDASFTSPNSEVVIKLKKAVEDIYNIDAHPGGIGGGTCAGIFRKHGFNAVVWGKIDDTCHMPNEYCKIENLVGDAKVYAKLFSD